MPLRSTRSRRRWRRLAAIAGTAHRLVAGFRQERRRLAGAEHGEINGARGGPVDRAHFEPADSQRVVGAGQKVEIFARRIEGRRRGIGEAVGDLVRAPVGERVEKDRAQVSVQALRIGDPLRVRRPHRVEAAARIVVSVGIELHRGATTGDVDRPQIQMVVFEQQSLTVGRPRRFREKPL
jgi:hypothetical protein